MLPMRRKFSLTGLILVTVALAQEGHPLTGTWHGDRGGTGGQRTRVVLFMRWEDKKLVGTLGAEPIEAYR